MESQALAKQEVFLEDHGLLDLYKEFKLLEGKVERLLPVLHQLFPELAQQPTADHEIFQKKMLHFSAIFYHRLPPSVTECNEFKHKITENYNAFQCGVAQLLSELHPEAPEEQFGVLYTGDNFLKTEIRKTMTDETAANVAHTCSIITRYHRLIVHEKLLAIDGCLVNKLTELGDILNKIDDSSVVCAIDHELRYNINLLHKDIDSKINAINARLASSVEQHRCARAFSKLTGSFIEDFDYLQEIKLTKEILEEHLTSQCDEICKLFSEVYNNNSYKERVSSMVEFLKQSSDALAPCASADLLSKIARECPVVDFHRISVFPSRKAKEEEEEKRAALRSNETTEKQGAVEEQKEADGSVPEDQPGEAAEGGPVLNKLSHLASKGSTSEAAEEISTTLLAGAVISFKKDAKTVDVVPSL